MTAFLLIWKESGWPHENIVRMVNSAGALGVGASHRKVANASSASPVIASTTFHEE